MEKAGKTAVVSVVVSEPALALAGGEEAIASEDPATSEALDGDLAPTVLDGARGQAGGQVDLGAVRELQVGGPMVV